MIENLPTIILIEDKHREAAEEVFAKLFGADNVAGMFDQEAECEKPYRYACMPLTADEYDFITQELPEADMSMVDSGVPRSKFDAVCVSKSLSRKEPLDSLAKVVVKK